MGIFCEWPHRRNRRRSSTGNKLDILYVKHCISTRTWVQRRMSTENEEFEKKEEPDKLPLALRKTPRLSAGSKTSRGMQNPSRSSSKVSPSNTGEDAAVISKKRSSNASQPETPTLPAEKKLKKAHDEYCWVCHRDSTSAKCQVCPRSYHVRCIADHTETPQDWICTECDLIMKAENVDTCSHAIKMLSLDQLCNLLRFTLHRMKTQVVSDEFMKPVSIEEFPNYSDYVCTPMDLGTLEKNIKAKVYGCTESFLADSKWILHNSIVFNGYRHRLTSVAKAMVKICKHEMSEIESCPDCYHNAYTKRDNWFLEPCRPPHLLIWAKLKGFPYWPAKAMKIYDGNVDVRFFGAHDRAWIPVSQCFLLSENIPTPIKNKKKGGFEQSMEELDLHIKRLKDKYENFVYAPFRAKLEPESATLHVKQMVPSADLNPKRQVSKKKKSHSKPDAAQVDADEEKVDKIESILMESPSNESRTLPELPAVESTPPREAKQSSSLIEMPHIEHLASKDAPSGVFESTSDLSPQMMALDFHAPQIDLTKLAKTKHDETIKKLESTFEKIKESAALSESRRSSLDSSCNEDDVSKEAPVKLSDIATTSASDAACEKHFSEQENLSGGETSDHSCEVTSTTAASTSAFTDGLMLTSPKVRDKFAEKLSKTIASCKAKLGIDEVTEVEEDSEESEDDVMLEPIIADNADGTTPVNEEQDSAVKAAADDDEHSDGSRNEPKVDVSNEDKPAVDFVNILSGRDNATTHFKKNSAEDVIAEVDDGVEACGSSLSEEKQEIPVANLDQSSANTKDSSENLKPESESEDKMSKSSVQIRPQVKRPFPEMYESDADDDSHDENELVIDLDRKDTKPSEKSLRKRETRVHKRRPFGNIVQKGTKSASKGSDETDDLVLAKRICLPNPERILGNVSPMAQLPPLSPVAQRQDTSPQCPVRVMPPLQPCPTAASIGTKSSSSDISPCDVKKYSQKMVDFMRGTVEEMVRDMANTGNPEAVISSLQLEIERMQWRHQQELTELKHNTDLVLLEMRASMEAENRRSLVTARRQWEVEKQKAIDETKKKQWCAKCKKEAIFYCCWNTSYCDYPCQQSHWPTHMSSCTQAQVSNDADNDILNDIQKDEAELNKSQTSRLMKKNEINSGSGTSYTVKDFDFTMSNSRLMGLVDRPTNDFIIQEQAGSSSRCSPTLGQQVGQVPYVTSNLQVNTGQRRSQMAYVPIRSTSATTSVYQSPSVGSSLSPVSQGQGVTFSQRPLQLSGMMSPIIRSTHHSAQPFPMALPRSQQPRSLLPPSSNPQIQQSAATNFGRHNLSRP